MKHIHIGFLAIAFCVLLVGLLVFWGWQFSKLPPQEQNTSFTMLFAGDVMLDRGVEYYILQHQDWRWPFLNIANTLSGADLAFLNLESIISDKGENQGSIYSFRADPKTIEGLIFTGIDIVSVANNHSFDYGAEAFEDSMKRLHEQGIATIGGGTTKGLVNYKIIEDTTIAFLGYTAVGSPFWQATEERLGIFWIDVPGVAKLQEDIKTAALQADIVIVSLHFGEEYQEKQNVFQQTVAKAAIDAGADLVVGHHPHVVQPLEQYKQKWIAYSLGNFVFDQGFSKETLEGMLLKVVVEQKSITQVVPLYIEISNQFQPKLKTKTPLQ